MPNAILKFKLPDEQYNFESALRGVNYKIALDNIDNHLRSKLKYEDLKDEEYHIYEKLRTFVLEEMHDAESSS